MLFSVPSLLFVTAIAGAAAWQGYGLPVLFASTLGVLILIVRGWSKASLSRIDFKRRLEATRAFPDETIRCFCTLDNRKPLPLIWVDVLDRIPEAVMPEPGELPDGVEKTASGLSLSTALLWYQAATWTHALNCRRRGLYEIGPAELTSGDLFGLLPRSRRATAGENLIVYPRIFELDRFGLPTRSPLGEIRSGNPLHSDPLLFRGLRDYAPEIPLRHIHWKATARTGVFQAKTFDPSSSLKAVIALDASAYAADDGIVNGDEFELAISTAASVAWHLARSGVAVGIAANTRLAGGGATISIEPKSGLEHLAFMLESLAKITVPSRDFGPFLREAESLFAFGTSVIVVTGGLQDSARVRLARLRRQGHPLMALVVGDSAPDEPVLPWRRVGDPMTKATR